MPDTNIGRATRAFCAASLLSLFVVACSAEEASPELGETAAALTQATYYVSPYGSDAWPGTLAKPFASVNRARQAAAAITTMSGDIVIYLRGGTYPLAQPLSFSASDSGRNGYQVIYQAYPGETPILSGGQRVTGWSLSDPPKNIWRAAVSTALQTRQLYINGKRAQRARGALDPVTRIATGHEGAANVGFVVPDIALKDARNLDEIEFVYTGESAGARRWVEYRCGVKSATSTIIVMDTWCFHNATTIPEASPNLGSPTFVENAYELLDQPGEWYLDRPAGFIYYIPRSGELLDSTVDAVVPVLETLVSATNLSNVQFRGITFAYATWLHPSGGEGFVPKQADRMYVDLYEDDPAPESTVPGNVAFRGANNVWFDGNVFAHLGASGLALDGGSRGCTVTGNRFFDVSATGLRLGNVNAPNATGIAQDDRFLVANNYIHDLPVEYRSAVGVMAGYLSNLQLRNNELANLPYSGVSLGWGWGVASYARNNQISANHIYNYMQVLADGGGIYTLSPQGSSTATQSTISNNYIHAAKHLYSAVYHDEGSAWFNTAGNVFAAVPYWFLNNGAASGYIQNNHISVRDNFTDGGSCRDNLGPGAACVSHADSIVYSNNALNLSSWPAAAASVIANAGVEPAYRSILATTAGRNLAHGQPASASSVFSSASGAALANDGSIGSGWSPSASTARHWWQVDLGRAYPLSEIEVVTRQDLDQPETRRNFAVWASNNADMDLGHVVLATQGSSALPNRATFRAAVSDTIPYRYIAVVKTVAESMHIGEVRVYGAELNLAAGKPASASSVFAPAYAAPMANDTNTSSGWSPVDGGVPWWQVDLGGAYSLAQVQLVTRQDLDQPETRRNFAVWASNNADMDLGHVVLGVQGNASLPNQATWTLAVNDATPYRYLALVKTAPEYFFIGDVRVYGRDPNIAIGKPATASSTWGSGYEASKGNDGNVNTGWSTASAGSNYWQVDLGRPYNLSEIRLSMRQDLNEPEDRQNFQIWASNDEDMGIGHVVLGVQGNTVLPYQGSYSARVTDPTPYRYVAVIDASFIAELAIHGH